MPDYNLYDKIVAETLGELLQEAMDKQGIVINNYLELEHIKYFIEVAKMATNLTQTPLYVRMKFFSFYKYKFKNRKLMKGVKRHTDRIKIESTNIPLIMDNILKKYEMKYSDIFISIYKEYYAVK